MPPTVPADPPEVWLIRGEGGAVIPMALPLGEGITSRLRSGALMRVDEDGFLWTEPVVPADPTTLADVRIERELAENAAEVDEVPLPKPGDRVALWEAYAVSKGMTREAAQDLTKPELIARFGKPSS